MRHHKHFKSIRQSHDPHQRLAETLARICKQRAEDAHSNLQLRKMFNVSNHVTDPYNNHTDISNRATWAMLRSKRVQYGALSERTMKTRTCPRKLSHPSKVFFARETYLHSLKKPCELSTKNYGPFKVHIGLCCSWNLHLLCTQTKQESQVPPAERHSHGLWSLRLWRSCREYRHHTLYIQKGSGKLSHRRRHQFHVWRMASHQCCKSILHSKSSSMLGGYSTHRNRHRPFQLSQQGSKLVAHAHWGKQSLLFPEKREGKQGYSVSDLEAHTTPQHSKLTCKRFQAIRPQLI